jgi:hypothetical protein
MNYMSKKNMLLLKKVPHSVATKNIYTIQMSSKLPANATIGYDVCIVLHNFPPFP